jgi:hypothetical protein
MGWTPRSTWSPTPPRPSAPSVSATRAVAPRSPLSMAARRTRSRGTPAALAMASAITPSRAPWRSSPRRSRLRSCPSGSVARANSPVSTAWRSATDPGPVMPSMVVTARSTSATVSVGSAAGVTSTLRTEAQPMPTRPCRGRPTRKPTAASTSDGSRRRSRSASVATLAERRLVAATSSEVATRSASSTAIVQEAGGGAAARSVTCRGACPGRGPWPSS